MIRTLFSYRRLSPTPQRVTGKTRLGWHCRIGAALLGVLVCALLPGAGAQPTNVNLERDFPLLVNRVRTNQPADYVIVIDRSGSMRPFWHLVRQAVASFLEAVPDGDYVSIVEFGTEARNSLTPRPINAQTRADLISEIGNLPEPTDQATDIGRGIEKTLDELNRPNGNRLKFVFFLTDFAHDPPAQSPYYRQRSPQDEAWRRLAERMRNEQSANITQSYALLLPIGGAVGRDLALGRAVFPGLESVSVNQATLASWFERRKAEIARDKLRAVVEHDANRVPLILRAVEQRASRLVAVFELVADRAVETSAITDVRIEEANFGGLQARLTPETARLPPLTLTPGAGAQTLEIPLAVVGEQSALRGWAAHDRISFRLRATQTLEPAGEIARLNLPGAREFEVAVGDHEASVHGGYLSPRMVIALLAGGGLILLLILFALRRRYRPEYIVGEIAVVGGGTPVRLRPENKRQTFKIGDVNNADGIAVKGASWVLVLQAFKASERPRGTYARMERGQATLNKKVALNNQQWEPIQHGSLIEVKNGKTVAYK